MTAIFDPTDPSYLDEKSVRDEFTRVATVCRDCRLCTDLCGTFPTLFALVDGVRDHDPGRLTPVQQDVVTDGCFQCGRCVDRCPYAPGVHDLDVDVPRLVLRHAAMRRATGQVSLRSRVGTWLLTRRRRLAGLVRAEPGSPGRRLVGACSDVSPTRRLGANLRPTFSERSRGREPRSGVVTTSEVTVFPTCVVDHEAPRIGEALVRVFERNGVGCHVTGAGCCGAPWLHAGDVEEFGRIARRNVRVLADEIRRCGDVVVPQPSCLQVLTRDVPAHVGGTDAEFVAAHIVGAVEYLMAVHDEAPGGLDTEFPGPVPGRIACHVAAPSPPGGSRAVELLQLTGADVRPVDLVAGTGITWGWRATHVDASLAFARRLVEALGAPAPDLVVGEDHRANVAILEQTGVLPSHPLEVVARAYGPDGD